MSLGDQLRKYRLANGFTQLEIAKTLGIDRSSYSNYESDATNPSIENLCALAKIFGTTPDVLTGFCSGKNEPSDSVAYSHRVYNGCDELCCTVCATIKTRRRDFWHSKPKKRRKNNYFSTLQNAGRFRRHFLYPKDSA